MKPKRANEANFLPYFSHISTVYSRGNKAKLCSMRTSWKVTLVIWVPFFHGPWVIWTNQSRKESELTQELTGKKINPDFSDYQRLLSDFFMISHEATETQVCIILFHVLLWFVTKNIVLRGFQLQSCL